jgi:hypothetical protein
MIKRKNKMKTFKNELPYIPLSSEIEQSRQERRERKLLLLIVLGGVVFMIGIEVITRIVLAIN